MKKITIVILFSLFLLNSCDDIPSEVVDTAEVDYELKDVTAPSEVIYNGEDSLVTTSLEFINVSTISSVWFNVVTENGATTVKQRVPMEDDGSFIGDELSDGAVYTGSTVMGSGIASGKYVIEYFVEDNVTAGDGKIRQVASHSFNFLTSEENVEPVLSNLNFVDSVARSEQFVFSVKANDDNGYTDLVRVYYEVFDPQGTQLQNSQGIKEFPMFDDGSTGGDEKAQDGIFSVALTFPESFQTGDYRFELTAEDKTGGLSNTITHTLTLR